MSTSSGKKILSSFEAMETSWSINSFESILKVTLNRF
jgi:hypothetical protein